MGWDCDRAGRGGTGLLYLRAIRYLPLSLALERQRLVTWVDEGEGGTRGSH